MKLNLKDKDCQLRRLVRFRRWLAWRLVRGEVKFVVENACGLGVNNTDPAKTKESAVCDAIALIFQH